MPDVIIQILRDPLIGSLVGVLLILYLLVRLVQAIRNGKPQPVTLPERFYEAQGQVVNELKKSNKLLISHRRKLSVLHNDLKQHDAKVDRRIQVAVKHQLKRER